MADTDGKPVVERTGLEGRARRAARSSAGAGGPEARDASFRDVGQSLREGRWMIVGVLTVSVAAAVAYVLLTPPVYRATALLQVEPRPEADRRLEDLSALFEPRSRAESEVEILRSRLVVGTALDRLSSDVDVHPRWFPVVGAAMARRAAGGAPAQPPFGLARLAPYAWGGERISVKTLRVPESMVGRRLTLTALGGDRLRLSDERGATLLEGAVGAALSASAPGGAVELTVTELSARPGTRFEVRKLSRPELTDRVLSRLRVAERGAGSGVIAVSYEAGNPADASAFVSALCAAFLEQDAGRSTSEVEQTLAFLEAQLPQLKSDLQSAENALTRYRQKQSTVDLPLEAKGVIDRTLELDRVIGELTLRRAELAQRYTGGHALVKELDQQIAAARAERDALAPRRQDLPSTQLGAERLVRNVDMAADLYVTLLKRTQDLRIVKAGRSGNIRVIDWPTQPYRPVRPVPALVLGLGVLLGLAGGVAAALGRRAMDRKAEDPRDIEDGTGLPVFVTIPHSGREVALQRSAGRGRRVLLALAAPDEAATEMLRTLRTALGFVLKARGKIVTISSPSAGVGKSFVCANLAQLLAAAGQRVLLVDGDLRQGRLHRYFSAEQSPGLADVLGGDTTIESAIKPTGTAGLDLLACGEPADAPAELLARPRLAEVLASAVARYDVVLVDTPPILAVTDALLLARSASVNLLVLRARQHPLPEIADALELFARSGVAVHGGILNDARPASGYGRAYARRTGPSEVTSVAG